MDLKPLIKEDFLIIEKGQTLSQLIGKLKTSNQRNALIFDHGKFEGIIEDKWLLKSKLDASQTKISKFVKKIPLAAPETDLIEAAYLMFQSNITSLPITRNKHIQGVVRGLDLLKEATKLSQLKGLTVNYIKIDKVPKLNTQDPVSMALSIMFQKKVEHVPISDKGKFAGIISYRDILKKYYLSPVKQAHSSKDFSLSTRAFTPNRPAVSQLPVSSFDTHYNLQTVTEESKLIKAINLMHQKNLTCLVVLRGQETLGLLTVKNILRKIASFKIPSNFNIKFIGLAKTKLEPYQKYNLKKIASQEAFKLQRGLHNQFSVIIHLKEYEKEGKRDKQHKYSINLKVAYPGQTIISDKGKQQGTWDVETALRKAFNNAKNKLKIKFRGDSSHRKGYE